MGVDLTGLGSVADFGKALLDRVWANKNDPTYIAAQTALQQAKDAGTLKQMDNEFQLSLEQIKANAVAEAKPGMSFRDGAGWTCVFSFAVMSVKPLIEWGSIISGHPIKLPDADATVAMTMLTALLGVGGMHTYQTVKTQ